MSVYDVITDRIIEKLEAGTVPWRQPWRGGEAGMPRNLATGYPYRGINVFLLAASGYASPHWLTFRQVNQRGGTVRRGERGTPVVFWKWREVAEHEADGSEATRRVPLLRYYTVFNAEQCEGIDVPAPDEPDLDFAPIARCEALVHGMPDAPAIETGRGQAAYQPARDTVLMPAPRQFESAAAYYATLFHELTHATGHARRLARPAVMEPATFASHAYSKEELVAEMGAAFLCGHCGIEAQTIERAAAYIAGWLSVLRGDSHLVVQAAAHAQRAADFLLGRMAQVREPAPGARAARAHQAEAGGAVMA